MTISFQYCLSNSSLKHSLSLETSKLTCLTLLKVEEGIELYEYLLCLYILFRISSLTSENALLYILRLEKETKDVLVLLIVQSISIIPL